MLHFSDTVAAVSTPRGKGGIAVIRISGPETGALLHKIFRGKLDPVSHPRHACFGAILDTDGTELDEGLVLYFPAPHSFTGEDVAEISCHGGALLTETILTAVLSAGARAAALSVPTRYVHSGVEMLDLNDAVACVDLTVAWLRK